jgi:hypothetical protein
LDSAVEKLALKLSRSVKVPTHARRTSHGMTIVKAYERLNPFAADSLTLRAAPQAWNDPIDISIHNAAGEFLGDMRLEVRHDEVDTGTKYPRHLLKAMNQQGREMGRIEWQRSMGQRHPVIQWVETFSGAEKQGIANSLLQRALLLEPKLHHSSDVTRYGARWQDSLKKAGLKVPRSRNA